MIEGLPCVVKDHNSKTAIVIKQGRKYIHVVPRSSGKLTVKRYTERQYLNNQYQTLDVNLLRAIDSFLAHGAGLTDTATNELTQLREALHEPNND